MFIQGLRNILQNKEMFELYSAASNNSLAALAGIHPSSTTDPKSDQLISSKEPWTSLSWATSTSSDWTPKLSQASVEMKMI